MTSREKQRPERIEVLGAAVDVVTLDEAERRIARFWSEGPGEPRHVVTLNPELVMKARSQAGAGRDELLRAINEAALVVADGIGIVWASRVMGLPLPERVPGIELAERALARAAEEGRRVYLLGGQPGVAAEAAAALVKRWPRLCVAGAHHGYFMESETDALVERIAREKVDLLLVGMGAPKQELWIRAHRERLGARVQIGVGGALDVFAGRARRAPVLLRRLGLEWAYRLAREPRRIVRMTALPRFAFRVLWEQWVGGN